MPKINILEPKITFQKLCYLCEFWSTNDDFFSFQIRWAKKNALWMAVKLPFWTRVSGFSVSEEFISFRVQKRIPNLMKRLISVLKSRMVILRKYEYSKSEKYIFLPIIASISLFNKYPNCTSINMWEATTFNKQILIKSLTTFLKIITLKML